MGWEWDGTISDLEMDAIIDVLAEMRGDKDTDVLRLRRAMEYDNRRGIHVRLSTYREIVRREIDE